jgi:hypothetical protein
MILEAEDITYWREMSIVDGSFNDLDTADVAADTDGDIIYNNESVRKMMMVYYTAVRPDTDPSNSLIASYFCLRGIDYMAIGNYEKVLCMTSLKMTVLIKRYTNTFYKQICTGNALKCMCFWKSYLI